MKNAEYVLNLGRKFVDFWKKGRFIGLITVGIMIVFLIVHCCAGGGFSTFINAFAFDFYMLDGLQSFVIILIFIGALCFFISLALFFIGVHYIGLGQIAINTCKPEEK